MKRFFTENLPLKIISAVVGMVLYLFVMQEKEAERQFTVPVQVDERLDNWVLRTEMPDLQVVVAGRARHLARLDNDELEELVVQLDETKPLISFSAADFDLPAGLEVRSIFPESVQLSYAHLTTREIPVLVNNHGRPHPDYSVVDIRAMPERIEVTGPEEDIADLVGIYTSRIDVYDTQTESIEREVELITPGAYMSYDRAQRVLVRIDIQPNESTTDLLARIELEGPTDRFSLEEGADQARVWLIGPPSIIHGPDPIAFRVIVSTASHNDSAAGRYLVEPQVGSLPQGVRVLRVDPTAVPLLVAETDQSVRLLPIPIPIPGILPMPIPTIIDPVDTTDDHARLQPRR